MTDSSRTPAAGTQDPTLQVYGLLKQIQKAERPEGLNFGGASFAEGADRITATVVFPIERIDTPDGVQIRVLPMTK